MVTKIPYHTMPCTYTSKADERRSVAIPEDQNSLSFSLSWTISTSAGTAKLPNLQVPSIPHPILGLGTKLQVQSPHLPRLLVCLF